MEKIWVIVLVVAVVLLWALWRKTGRSTAPSRLTPDPSLHDSRVRVESTGLTASNPSPRSRATASTTTSAAALRPAAGGVSLPSTAVARQLPPPERGRQAAPPATARWVSPDEPVVVRGRALRGGMLYVGSGLPTLRDWCLNPEPALIDPALPVDDRDPDHAGESMSYWPSYSAIAPRSRSAYLHWLANDRRSPDAYIGYVFLFFYGLERRLLGDGSRVEVPAAEVDALSSEIERLLAIYAGNRSFRRYGSSLLGAALLLRRAIDIDAMRPPMERDGWELPVALRLAIGAMAKEGRPLPPEWALSWALTAPELPLRTPAQRCPNELRELFLLRYRDAFGDGLKLKANKTRLRIEHHPASASFGGVVTLTSDLPDVTSTSAPLERLRRLVDQCCDDLDPYSRWVGRTGDSGSPAAIAMLPAPLAGSRGDDTTRAFDAWLERQLAEGSLVLVDTPALLAQWPAKDRERPTRRELESLSDYLATRGLGVEPDVTFGGASLARGPRAALFRLPGGARESPSAAFGGAAVLLQLAATVAAADGDVSPAEQRHLTDHLETALDLDIAQRVRLEARFRCLAADPPAPTRAKKSIEQIELPERQSLGAFLVALAGADGHLAPQELKVLAKIYPLLGLQPEAVYSHVHELVSSQVTPAEAPVAVRPADLPAGFSIPRPKDIAEIPPGAVRLDLEKVRAKLAETESVSRLLGEIFVEEAVELRPAASAQPSVADDSLIPGLDGVHSALLLTLAGAGAWDRARLERLADELGLLPDGALEVINEAAFAACGAPLFEGEDPIEIDRAVLQEMLP